MAKQTKSSWTQEELQILSKHYDKKAGELAALLPTRTVDAIRDRLRVERKEKGVPIKPHKNWTDAELQIVRNHYRGMATKPAKGIHIGFNSLTLPGLASVEDLALQAAAQSLYPN